MVIEKTFLKQAKKLIARRLAKADKEKVLFLPPEEVKSFLKRQAAKAASQEVVIGGRSVKKIETPVSEEKEKSARESILKVLLGPLRRPKGKK